MSLIDWMTEIYWVSSRFQFGSCVVHRFSIIISDHFQPASWPINKTQILSNFSAGYEDFTMNQVPDVGNQRIIISPDGKYFLFDLGQRILCLDLFDYFAEKWCL